MILLIIWFVRLRHRPSDHEKDGHSDHNEKSDQDVGDVSMGETSEMQNDALNMGKNVRQESIPNGDGIDHTTGNRQRFDSQLTNGNNMNQDGTNVELHNNEEDESMSIDAA